MEKLKDVLKGFFRRENRVFLRVACGDEMYEGMNTDDEDGLRLAGLIEILDLPVLSCQEIAIPGEMGECFRIDAQYLKKFLVTDPRYLLGRGEDAGEMRNAILPRHSEPDAVLRSREIRLSRFICTPARLSPAGCAGWANRICGPGVIRAAFDGTGHLCVCELTREVQELLVRNEGKVKGAVFETGEVRDVTFSRKNPNWTQVIIRTSEGVVSSLARPE